MKTYNLAITDRCNLSCRYCYPEIWKNHKEKTPNSLINLKKKIIHAKKTGASNINFANGESTISPNLIPLIRFCSQNNLTSSITTNGVRLADEIFLKDIISAGISKIEFTFNSIDERANQLVYQQKDVTSKQIKALTNIKKYDIFLSVFTIISSANYLNLRAHVDFLINNFKIDNISLIYVITKTGSTNFLPKYSASEKYILSALDSLSNSNYTFQVGNIPLCFLKKNKYYKKTFEYLGIPPCPDPNLKKVTHSGCKHCNLKSRCGGINEYYYSAYGTSELVSRAFHGKQ